MAIGTFIGRNFVSIAFPSLTALAIWVDWSYTRRWKEAQKQLSK